MKSNFISCIYQYCDRRCEKCTFQQQCSLFANSGNSKDEEEMSNEMLISSISEKLKCLNELFEHRDEIISLSFGQHQGVQNDNDDELTENFIENSSILVLATAYSKMVNQWFAGTSLDGFIEEIQPIIKSSPVDHRELTDDMERLRDWIDGIIYFVSFIPMKLRRSLKNSRGMNWYRKTDVQDDCNGSAKIAIIGMEHSMLCWSNLMEYIPEFEDECLSFLVKLEQLKLQTLKEFPRAMEFTRPGFDTKSILNVTS